MFNGILKFREAWFQKQSPPTPAATLQKKGRGEGILKTNVRK